MSGSSRRNHHDSVYPSQCKFQRLFNPHSMYEFAPTRGRPSEPHLSRSRSNQSLNAYKRLPSSVPYLSKPKGYKTRLSVGKGLKAHPKPPRDRTKTVPRWELTPKSRTHTPAEGNGAPSTELTSYRMSNSSRCRSLSPSFLDLSDSPEYHPASATSVSTTNPTSRVKRKGKPPPLILRDSFHFPDSQPATLPIPLNNPKAAPLTPMTPFTPISPRYRMPSEKEQFRRRLLKLQRTLGEQITPGLVVRPKSSYKTTADVLDDYKGETTFIKPNQRGETFLNAAPNHSPPTSTLCAPPALDSNFLENLPLTHKTKRDYLPETVVLSPMTLTKFAGPPVTPSSITSTGSSIQFVLNYDAEESSSDNDDYDTPPISPLDGSWTSSPFDDSYPPSPVQFNRKPHIDEVNADIANAPHLAVNRTGLDNTPISPGIKRKERRHGWSGEWNQPHIQVVIEKLRIL